MNIAVITARGGSKRIPKKNIKEFCGRPIIEYSIQAAKKAGIFDTIMVSTDNEQIAQVARNAGAEVPFMRSQKTSDDYATTADVLKEVLEKYKEQGMVYENVCCIYPTAPFVTGEKLKNALDKLVKERRDSVIPVTSFSFPPLRGMEIKDGCLKYKWEQYSLMRSQDLEEIYHDCGQFYMLRTEIFLKEGKLVTGNTGALIVPELEVQDIDNEMDWKLAEMKYQLLKKEG